MDVAVVVTTYNRPDALAAVMNGYCGQTDQGFELIVADDGSTGETRELVESYQSRAPMPVRHVWQEDAGFRAAAARNRAIVSSHAAYIIFTDGDCVPSRQFVAAHKRLARAGYFVAANRVLLSAACTRRVLSEREPVHLWNWRAWLRAWLRRDVNRLMPLLRLPDGRWRERHPQRWKGVKTCNMAVWRSDLLRVNGLDECYEGWGLEDSDLVIRLLHAGVRHKSARFAAPVFHLWHAENDRSKLVRNQQRLDALLNSTQTRAVRGLDQYAAAAS
jgi:glycosyltransferase involved in cell wall biosynthesis